MPTKKQIEDVLKTVPDPELNVSVWDLGLIYDVKTTKKTGRVRILMTLTTVGCPLYQSISDVIRQRVKALEGVKQVDIELTFDPPWTVERMTQEARIKLGML